MLFVTGVCRKPVDVSDCKLILNEFLKVAFPIFRDNSCSKIQETSDCALAYPGK